MASCTPFRLLLLVLLGSLTATAAPPADETGIRLHDVQIRLDDRAVRVSLVIFDSAKFAFRIIDNAADNRPRYSNLAAAMADSGCLAGCNGGFFNRDPFDPYGLMISSRRAFGTFDPQSWMNGLLVLRGPNATLEPAPALVSRDGIDALLQSGPWLVRNGAPVPDLDPARQAPRTFVCRDDRGLWAIGASATCSLSELARLLSHPAVKSALEISDALNLDGGPSTGLWFKQTSAPFYLREGWPVRNYLGIVPRPGLASPRL